MRYHTPNTQRRTFLRIDRSADGDRVVPRPSAPPVLALVLSAGLAVVVLAVFALVFQPRERYTSDFCSFWAGARLAGPGLYDVSRAEAIQRDISPLVRSKRYIRPPFYALALWPLGQLPFQTAYVLWCAVNLAAVLAFVRVWRLRPESYIACALFLPLWWSFGIGQDVPLLLLIVATGARLIERKREIIGGALLALCAMKPHLSLFVPVVLLAQKKYRALLGMLGGGAVLFVLSGAMLGLEWPLAFVRAARENEAAIQPRLLGIAGLLARIDAPRWLLPAAIVIGAVIVYRWARVAAWQPSVAFALAAGVAFGPRAMVYDAALFLPLLLLCFPPVTVVAIGVALATLVTPAALVAELVSIALVLQVWRLLAGSGACKPSHTRPSDVYSNW